MISNPLDGAWPLACPECRGELQRRGDDLACAGCAGIWPIREGLPRLYREHNIKGTDRLMRRIYNGLPALHDPATRLLTPLMQGISEGAMRAGYIPRLELGALTAPQEGGGVRILEVGVGSGANLPLVASALPSGLGAEIWGADLSEGMLGQSQRRLEYGDLPPVHLLMADAHALPFASDSFDRVFHVGAMGSYNDPRAALSEMARVARPGTPIVVVDEQLDPKNRHTLYDKIWFKMLTFYDKDPHCPTEMLPAEAYDVLEEQVSRFYYCLRFRV